MSIVLVGLNHKTAPVEVRERLAFTDEACAESLRALVVGAGEMAELAAQHLAGAGATRILVANRTYEKAQELAVKFGGEAVEFAALEPTLAEADIVICSTGAQGFVITPEMAERARQ